MQRIFTVTQINKYIKSMMDYDPTLFKVQVSGEISNFKFHSSGHMYFTVKDAESVIKCVMFRGANRSLQFKPEDGMEIVVKGKISVFTKAGQYQLYAESLNTKGEGTLYKKFEELKLKLEEEGIFDPKYKKQLPYIPRKIGVITSETGSVIQDIIKVLSRRFPGFKLKLIPVNVQGIKSASEIVDAIKLFNKLKNVDVIILGRGGGSLEELWSFNEEKVAREIFNSEIPIVSAVGHETDFTISDFAADVRAATPSQAAELVVPELNELLMKIENYENRMLSYCKNNIYYSKDKLKRLINNRIFLNPANIFDDHYQELDKLTDSLYKLSIDKLKSYGTSVDLIIAKLDMLSPLKTLLRSYCIATLDETGQRVGSVDELSLKKDINLILKDGKALCLVKEIKKEKIYG